VQLKFKNPRSSLHIFLFLIRVLSEFVAPEVLHHIPSIWALVTTTRFCPLHRYEIRELGKYGDVQLKSTSQGTSDFGSNFVKLARVLLDYLWRIVSADVKLYDIEYLVVGSTIYHWNLLRRDSNLSASWDEICNLKPETWIWVENIFFRYTKFQVLKRAMHCGSITCMWIIIDCLSRKTNDLHGADTLSFSPFVFISWFIAWKLLWVCSCLPLPLIRLCNALLH
jgi:hypothetical protein